MQPMRAISQRVFVEHAGSPRYLRNVAVETGLEEGEFILAGYLPGGLNLDLRSPQTLYLVFQVAVDPHRFFDERRLGRMIILERFRVVEDVPLVLLRNLETGEVTLPMPEYRCTCETIQQQPVGQYRVGVVTMRR